MSKIP